MNITKEQAEMMQARVNSKGGGYHLNDPNEFSGKTVIVLYELVPGLNGDQGLMRSHWTKNKKLKETYTYQIKAATKNKHEGQVKITYTRYYAGTPMDWDNAAASFKHVGDSLVKAGVIKDDNPRIVVEFIPKQVKVPTRADQRTEIVIEDIV